MTPDGATLIHEWQASTYDTKREFWRREYEGLLSYNAMIGRMWRAEQSKIIARPELFNVDLGAPWEFDWDSCIIIGDVQIPTTDYDFAALPMAVAQRYLPRPRRLIIAGDLINADAFSDYDSDVSTPTLEQETEAGWQFFNEYLTVFDEIYWTFGNHERRSGRKTNGAIQPKHLLRMLTHDPRVKISQWGHCVIRTPNRLHDWRISHGRSYSVNQLVNAERMAHKYQQNIISWHEHHCAIGFDRFKRFVVVNGGGLFNYSQMGYAVMDDSTSAGMMPGFVLMRHGWVDVLAQSDEFTNWDVWLPERRRKARAA